MERKKEVGKVSFSAVIRKEGINPYVDPPFGTGEKLGKKGVVPVKVRFLDPSTEFRAGGLVFKANLMPLGAKRTQAPPGRHHRLYLHGIMRKAIGKDTSDRVRVELTLDTQSRVEPMNRALARELKKDRKARAVFEAMSPSHRKEYNRYLNHLKGLKALQRNVEKVMKHLKNPESTWFGKKAVKIARGPGAK